MRVSIILGHPTPDSFNHAIASTAIAALQANGHTVDFHDLYREGFDPVMPSSEIPKDAVLPPAIEQHCQEIGEADGIIVIHPNWWSAPPAILRGWVDRVLRAGRAYNFVPNGEGGAKPVGLLKARVGLVFTTANTPHETEVAAFGDPLDTHWLKVVFGLCGVTCTQKWDFSPVIVSTLEQRRQWLRDVEEDRAAFSEQVVTGDGTRIRYGGLHMDTMKRVLLVDDDADFVDINRLILEKAGFEVVTASNGRDGFAAATSSAIDVAVLDVMMDTPTEGFVLARQLRQDDRTKHIPLLMLTSVNAENEAAGLFVRFTERDRDNQWLPVDRFVDKPIKSEELVSIVRTLAGAWTFTR